MEVYEKIKQLREDRNFTQKEVADSIDLNISVYKKIELGSRPIRENELALIADFFDVSTDFLLNRTSDPTPPKRSEEDQLGDSILSHFRLNTADMEVEDIEELEEELNEYMDFLVQRAKARKERKK
ncbi:helix-turn-helix domain-containing protein [Enterococcus sp. C57]|uniref:helix-turn-helix domain-containing protein n=1 Tax=unclassified Enterococcus TaxID=2608891 RepID=UPI0034A06F00